MKNYAPIIIFTYNRYDAIYLTINALKKNYLIDKVDIYIYSDKEKTSKDSQKVRKVRKYLNTLKNDFNSITIIQRRFNYGLARNIIEGVTELINKYEKVIVLEDDLITSENFLCYMHESLEYYKDRKDVFSISGYTGNLSSIKHLKEDSYLSYRPSSWGWGTWKNQWNNIDWEIKDFEEFIKNKKQIKKFNRGGIDMTRMLKHYQEGKNNSWAIRWSYAMYKQNKYSVYPKISKVQNIGFGDDATHCSGINIYKTTLDKTKQCTFNFTDETEPNKLIAKDFRYQYSYTNKLLKKIQGYYERYKK